MFVNLLNIISNGVDYNSFCGTIEHIFSFCAASMDHLSTAARQLFFLLAWKILPIQHIALSGPLKVFFSTISCC